MTVIDDTSEKEPLVAVPPLIKKNENLNMPVWLALTLGISVNVLHMCAVVLTSVVLNQYSYQAHYKLEYPNATINSTGVQSACALDTTTVAYKEQVVVQKLTSEWNIYCTLGTYNVIGILFTLNLATYSDVYGRKLFFFAPLVGSGLKVILCAIGIYFEFNINLFIIFHAIEGCTGSWVSTLSLVYSFMADLTEAGKPRTLVIGIFETASGLGIFAITLLSGYLIKWTNGFFYPIVLSASMIVAALFIITCLLPETLTKSDRRTGVSFLGNMGRVFECYKPGFSPLGKRWMYITLVFIFMMSCLANLGRPSVELLYQLNAPFCWSSVKIGWYSAMGMGLKNTGNLLFIKLFHYFTTDEFITLASMVTSAVSLVVEGFASTDTLLYTALGLSIGSSISMATCRAILSRITPADKQGSVFAGIAVFEIGFSLISLLGSNVVYDATVGIYRGMTFFIMAGYAVIGFFLCVILIIGLGDDRFKNVNDVTVSVNETIRYEPYKEETNIHVQDNINVFKN